jgi:molecular chaperone GrpE
MTDPTARAPEGASQTPGDAAPAAAQETAAEETSSAPAESPTPDPLETATKEAAEFRDRWMRTLAEMENLRRRTEREVADARTYGVTSFAREVLAVGDNLQRALDALGPDVRTGADSAIQSLIEGVELTERDLLKALEKHGIKKLTPQGEKFDPNLHQAMYEVPDASVPAGTVVQVVQAGYTIGDRVLRPALVAVAKGGPKVAAEAAGAEAPANDNVGGEN